MQYVSVNSITAHQRKITYYMVTPTNLDKRDSGLSYLLPSKIFLLKLAFISINAIFSVLES